MVPLDLSIRAADDEEILVPSLVQPDVGLIRPQMATWAIASASSCGASPPKLLANLKLILEAQILPPGQAGMSGFRGGLAFDSVDFGWFQVLRGGCDRYSVRFDVNSMLTCLAAARLDTISTLFRHSCC
jgi:hypothetical protein